MRLRSHVSRLEVTLRRPASHSLLAALPVPCNRYRYSSTSAAYPERIAVLGGGIAGLSSAYFISKEFPKSKITIFEAGKTTGGWIKSKRVEVSGGTITFEAGPRTLRPNAPVTAHLIQELDLVKDVTYTFKTAPGAINRYIFYPDRLNRLAQGMPSFTQFISLWRSGLLSGIWSLFGERRVPPRSRSMTDETIGSFVTRRTDIRLANNVFSAVMHGIYAGDIWQLSARTLLKVPWQLEANYGSVIGGILVMISDQTRRVPTLTHPYDADMWKAINSEVDLETIFRLNLERASTFTLKGGLQRLVHKLQESVEENGKVQIDVNTRIERTDLVEGESKQVAVTTKSNSSTQTQNFDLVISTLRDTALTPYVTVMTVNLYYTNPHLIEDTPGFGYLIPQSVPFEQNPERALGVIFDSSAANTEDTATGTKLTVMLGGHYWDGWAAYPDEEEGLEMAKNIVQRHLKITDEPEAYAVNLHKDCIPQYTIGYDERLKRHAEDLSRQFKGRLRVVGNQYNGVGVNDCITGAWNVARELRGSGWKSRSCGLDRAVDEREWTLRAKKDVTYSRRW